MDRCHYSVHVRVIVLAVKRYPGVGGRGDRLEGLGECDFPSTLPVSAYVEYPPVAITYHGIGEEDVLCATFIIHLCSRERGDRAGGDEENCG